MGRPKALVVGADGVPWLRRGVLTLLAGGCRRVIVVLGAAADQALANLPADQAVTAVVAEDWADGLSASLRAALGTLRADADADAALVSLVDLPRLPVGAVARLHADARRMSLRQATYAGRPGHPVLIGAEHWDLLAADLSGDRGAGRYLRSHGAHPIPCDDLWDGADVDAAPDAHDAASASAAADDAQYGGNAQETAGS